MGLLLGSHGHVCTGCVLRTTEPGSKLVAVSQGQVAPVYNPSYSGGRDQEGRGSKSTWANSARDPISKITIHKKGLVEWLKW
jgi:hypothetical protein